MIRKILLLVAVIAASAVAAQAQTLEAYKNHLATPQQMPTSADEVSVTVTEHGDAGATVAQISRAAQRYRMRGYRVCIFFDNGPSARAGAVRARNLFMEKYSGASYMKYENPYFKVTVGNCLTEEEAIILKGQIVGDFPKAYVKQEEIVLNQLL